MKMHFTGQPFSEHGEVPAATGRGLRQEKKVPAAIRKSLTRNKTAYAASWKGLFVLYVCTILGVLGRNKERLRPQGNGFKQTKSACGHRKGVLDKQKKTPAAMVREHKNTNEQNMKTKCQLLQRRCSHVEICTSWDT